MNKPKIIIIQWSIIGILSLCLYGEICRQWFIDLWNDPNYSHGLLIPFVIIYLLRERLPRLRKSIVKPYFPGLIMVVAALIIYIVARTGAELFSQRISFVLLIYSMILFLEGRQIARILLLPIGIVFFAIPLPYILYDEAAFPLKLIASQLSVMMFQVLNVSVFREGNIITLSHITLEVVDACSGIRSLMTLLTLSFFLACFQHKSLWRRGVLLLSAIPVAVVANAVRVTLTGLLTKYDSAWGEGTRHEMTGWLVFLVSFGALVGISALLQLRKTEVYKKC